MFTGCVEQKQALTRMGPLGEAIGTERLSLCSDGPIVKVKILRTFRPNVSGSSWDQQDGSFAQTNNCGTSVPAGGNCTISVTFTPKSKELKVATLEVKDNGGGGPQKVALIGIGTK
jgi:hypothetical protein